MVGELGRRQQHLTQLLSKKDKELQDFSEQGYTVTRSECSGRGWLEEQEGAGWKKSGRGWIEE